MPITFDVSFGKYALKNGDIFQISVICHESYPCQHNISYNDGYYKLIGALQILDILKKNDVKIPTHFQHLIKKSTREKLKKISDKVYENELVKMCKSSKKYILKNGDSFRIHNIHKIPISGMYDVSYNGSRYCNYMSSITAVAVFTINDIEIPDNFTYIINSGMYAYKIRTEIHKLKLEICNNKLKELEIEKAKLLDLLE